MAAKKTTKTTKKKTSSATKKKVSTRRKTASPRKPPSKAKKASRKSRSPTTSAKKKKPAKRTSATKRKTATQKSKKAKTTKKTAKRSQSLGRPRLPADAKLDHVFQKDYQAREIFAFLGVTTLRDLEEFGPDEIIDRLTSPMVETVERIRKALALNNRCLKSDRRFALKFQAAWKKSR